MTALSKYQRLESAGLWREDASAQLREVIVGLREATLIFSDPKTETPLAQWSLPALIRSNPGQRPALFTPGEDSTETLEIDDVEMIVALETVSTSLERRRAKPGRLRGMLVGGTAVILLAGGLFWLPGKLVEYTTAMLPDATRDQLGAAALADLTRLTGSPCHSRAGDEAAEFLAQRLSPYAPAQILVVRDGLVRAAALPGDRVVLPESLLMATDSPDVIAGYVLAERLKARGHNPTRVLLRHIGLWSTLRLLASGSLQSGSLQGYGEAIVAAPVTAPSPEDLTQAFADTGITSAPYGSHSGMGGLVDANPNGSAPPVLEDGEWLSLQSICQ